MYPHFIEINSLDLEGEIIVNIETIAFVCGEDEAQIILNVADREDNTINCKESYDEVKKLIKDSGCQIQMGDPRLDTTHPLTMKEIKRMIGEPVRNSNSRCWMLVSEDRGMAIHLIYNAGNGVDFMEGDLIKFPVYRMKR